MSGKRYGEIYEETAGTRADQDCPENDEQHDIGGCDQQRDAEDADGLNELAVYEAVYRNRRAVEHANEPVGFQGLDDEEPGNDHHRPADGASGRFDHKADQDPAVDDICRVGRAFAGLEFLDIGENVDLHREHQCDHRKIDAEAEHALCVSGRTGLPDGFRQRSAEHRLDQKGEQKHRAQVGRPEGQRFRRPETGDEDMVHRQCDSERRCNQCDNRREVEAPCAQNLFEQRILALFLVFEFRRSVGHGEARGRPPPGSGGR